MRIYTRDAQGDTKFRCTKGQLADTMLLGLLCYANMYDTSVSIHRSAIRDNARDNAFCAKEVDVFLRGKIGNRTRLEFYVSHFGTSIHIQSYNR